MRVMLLSATVTVLSAGLRDASAADAEPPTVVTCSEHQVACRRACIPLDENGEPDYTDMESLENCMDACDEVAFDCVVAALALP